MHELTLVLALNAVRGADCGVAGDALLPPRPARPSGLVPAAAAPAAPILPVIGVAGGPCCSALLPMLSPKLQQ